MARKKYVLIKVNNVNTDKQLAATMWMHSRHPGLWAPRFKGPVVIAESAAATPGGLDHYKYADVIPDTSA